MKFYNFKVKLHIKFIRLVNSIIKFLNEFIINKLKFKKISIIPFSKDNEVYTVYYKDFNKYYLGKDFLFDFFIGESEKFEEDDYLTEYQREQAQSTTILIKNILIYSYSHNSQISICNNIKINFIEDDEDLKFIDKFGPIIDRKCAGLNNFKITIIYRYVEE